MHSRLESETGAAPINVRSAGDATKVVAVLGTSFSGSTVFNLLLGAHSRIYAGGEMIGLTQSRHKEFSGSCTSCGLQCQFWNHDCRSAVRKGNLYALSRETFGKSIIVDSSKSLDWFKEMVVAEPGTKPVFVLMVKHPIRYLSSCVVNIGGSEGGYLRRAKGKYFGADFARKPDLKRWIDDLIAYYGGLLRSLPREIGGAPFHVVHYERMVAMPREAIGPLLETLGVDYETSQDDFYSAEFHQIGGNNGAIFQTKQSWNGGDVDVPTFRREFYQHARGMKIDDKYLNVFSSREMDYLTSHAGLARLTDMLGYGLPDMPFKIRQVS